MKIWSVIGDYQCIWYLENFKNLAELLLNQDDVRKWLNCSIEILVAQKYAKSYFMIEKGVDASFLYPFFVSSYNH